MCFFVVLSMHAEAEKRREAGVVLAKPSVLLIY